MKSILIASLLATAPAEQAPPPCLTQAQIEDSALFALPPVLEAAAAACAPALPSDAYLLNGGRALARTLAAESSGRWAGASAALTTMAENEFPANLSETTARGLLDLRPGRPEVSSGPGAMRQDQPGRGPAFAHAAAQSRRSRNIGRRVRERERSQFEGGARPAAAAQVQIQVQGPVQDRGGGPRSAKLPQAAADMPDGSAVSEARNSVLPPELLEFGPPGGGGEPGRGPEAGRRRELHRRPRRRRPYRDTGLVGCARSRVHHLFQQIQDRPARGQRGRGRDVRGGVDRGRLGDGAGRSEALRRRHRGGGNRDRRPRRREREEAGRDGDLRPRPPRRRCPRRSSPTPSISATSDEAASGFRRRSARLTC